MSERKIVRVDFKAARHERDVELVCAVIDSHPVEVRRAFQRVLRDLTKPIQEAVAELAARAEEIQRKRDERDARHVRKAKPAKKRR